jgi:hypothetical protein
VYDLATASQNCSTGSWICSEGSTKIREIILFNVISKSEKYNRDLKKRHIDWFLDMFRW